MIPPVQMHVGGGGGIRTFLKNSLSSGEANVSDFFQVESY